MTVARNAGTCRVNRRRGRPRALVGIALALALLASSCSSSTDGTKTPQPVVVVVSPQSCAVVGCVGEGIDTTAAAYTVSSQDLMFPAGVFGLGLSRTYRSDRGDVGWFGRGWATVYETTVTATASGLTVDAPAGLTPLWPPEAPDGWDVAGSVAVKSRPDGSDQLVWPTGETWSFDLHGQLAELASPYGQTMTIERTNGQPSALRSSQGPSVQFAMQNGRVVSAATDDGRVVGYSYDADRLVPTTAPGLALAYAYNADHQMVQLQGPSGATTVTYASGAVATQTTSSGQQFEISRDSHLTTVSSERTRTYQHDDAGRLTRIQDGSKNISMREFDSDGRLTKSTDFAQPGDHVLRTMQVDYDGDRVRQESANGVTTKFD